MCRNAGSIWQHLMPLCGVAFVFSAIFPFAATRAAAANAYRCSNQGTTVYSDVPCLQGQQAAIPLPPDQPTSADVAAAQRRAHDEKLQLNKIEAAEAKEQTQVATERKKARQHAAALERQCLHLKMKVQRAEEAVKSSSARASAEKKRKARHAEETYADECETTTATAPRLLIP